MERLVLASLCRFARALVSLRHLCTVGRTWDKPPRKMMESLARQSLAMPVVPECLVMLVAPECLVMLVAQEWLGPGCQQLCCAASVCRCKTFDDVLGHCRW